MGLLTNQFYLKTEDAPANDWFVSRLSSRVRVKWGSHEVAIQDFPKTEQKSFTQALSTMLTHDNLRPILTTSQPIHLEVLQDSKLILEGSNQVTVEGVSIPSGSLEPALVSSGIRKRNEQEQSQLLTLPQRGMKRVAKASLATSISHNFLAGVSSFYQTKASMAVSFKAVPCLKFIGVFLGLLSGPWGAMQARLAEKKALEIGDSEGVLLALVDKWILTSLFALDLVITSLFITTFAGAALSFFVIGSVALSAACMLLYLGLIAKKIYICFAAVKFSSDLEKAIKEGNGIPFLRDQLYLTDIELKEIEALPASERPIAKEKMLSKKREYLIRRTDDQSVEKIAQYLANCPEQSKQELFNLVRKSNYATILKTNVTIGAQLIGLGASVVGMACPMVAPASLLAAGSGLVWLAITTRLDAWAQKRASKKFDSVLSDGTKKRRYELASIGLSSMVRQLPTFGEAHTPNIFATN